MRGSPRTCASFCSQSQIRGRRPFVRAPWPHSCRPLRGPSSLRVFLAPKNIFQNPTKPAIFLARFSPRKAIESRASRAHRMPPHRCPKSLKSRSSTVQLERLPNQESLMLKQLPATNSKRVPKLERPHTVILHPSSPDSGRCKLKCPEPLNNAQLASAAACPNSLPQTTFAQNTKLKKPSAAAKPAIYPYTDSLKNTFTP